MEKLVGLAIIGFVLYTVFTHALPVTSSLVGLKTITEKPSSFKLLGTPDDAVGILEIADRNSKTVLASYYFDERGVLHESPEQAEKSPVIGTYRDVDTGLRLGVELGAYAAYSRTKGPVGGLRVSPARVYDYIALDVIAGPEAVGVGVSAYLPRHYGPAWLSHVGVGAWYAADLDGSFNTIFGLSLSTR